jgi:hypothetical protein
LVQIEFSVGKLVAQTYDDCVFTVDCCAMDRSTALWPSSGISKRNWAECSYR